MKTVMRCVVVACVVCLVSVQAFAQNTSEKGASGVDPALTCDENSAVLWRVEYGEDRYAEAFCKAGCTTEVFGYEKPTSAEDIKTCAKKVRKFNDEEVYDPSDHNNCPNIKHDIQMIRAWHGQKFDGVKWEPYFKANKSWYGTRKKKTYSSNAIKIKTKLEKLRARHCKMTKEEKRYASTLIAAFKRGKVSGSHAVWGRGDESEEPRMLRGKERNKILFRYNRMEYLKPTIYPSPRQYMSEDSGRSDYPKEVYALKYKATIHIRRALPTAYCARFSGKEDCGGQDNVTYYFDEDAKLIAMDLEVWACPFVYTRDESKEWSYQGEILRNLRSAELEESQTLAVQVTPEECEQRVVQVRMTEEKREVTHLDSVALQVGDFMLRPMQCKSGQYAAMCEDDGSYFKMNQGDELMMSFELPVGAVNACKERHVTLHANGYYLPTF